MPDAKILSTYPSLTPPDLEATWDYACIFEGRRM
jgi:uncharacterized protein (DUF433 family)